MADQGLWFKLWSAALDDPSLDNLDVSDFGRWAKLGAFIKRQGHAGSVSFEAPARGLCAMFQVGDFDALLAAFRRLPHVHVESGTGTVPPGTNATVSFANWLKYQGDFSTSRTRRFRERERSKRRGEEKRREENKTPSVPLSIDSLISELKTRPAYQGLDVRGAVLRCEEWCRANGHALSRRRVVNWLNKDAADRVPTNGGHAPFTGLDLRTEEMKRDDAARAATARSRS